VIALSFDFPEKNPIFFCFKVRYRSPQPKLACNLGTLLVARSIGQRGSPPSRSSLRASAIPYKKKERARNPLCSLLSPMRVHTVKCTLCAATSGRFDFVEVKIWNERHVHAKQCYLNPTFSFSCLALELVDEYFAHIFYESFQRDVRKKRVSLN